MSEVSVPSPKLSLDAAASCSYGDYPWDYWEKWAIAQGLAPKLAQAGRLLIREAYQHGWDPWVQSACGWSDDGKALLKYALRYPAAAQKRWAILMRTDGLSGDYSHNSEDWMSGFLRADAQELRLALRSSLRQG